MTSKSNTGSFLDDRRCCVEGGAAPAPVPAAEKLAAIVARGRGEGFEGAKRRVERTTETIGGGEEEDGDGSRRSRFF